MASRDQINRFLAEEQGLAGLLAMLATREDESPFDSVRNAMLRLTGGYPHVINSRLSPLFYRLLQQEIRRQHRRAARQNAWPRLRQALLPPREEDTTPHALETMTPGIADPTDPQGWRQPPVLAFVRAALQFLPPAERTALLCCHGRQQPAADTARQLAVGPRCLRRRAARASHTLAILLRQKGLATPTQTPEDLARLAVPALLSAIAQPPFCHRLERIRAEALARYDAAAAAPCRLSERLTAWYAANVSATRRTVIAGLLLVACVAGFRQLPQPAPDPAQTDIQLLAGEVPLDVLLGPRFEEALHD